jgi:hypothetical protein
MIFTRNIKSHRSARLVAELDQGNGFRAARRRAGVSWWDVHVWCLRGRGRVHNSPFSPQEAHAAFLLALAAARARTRCRLGPILDRLVRAYEPDLSRVP